MKRITLFLLMAIICLPSLYAAKLKVKLEAPDHAEGHNYAFGYTEYAWQLAPWREMNEMLLSPDGVFEMELPAGIYDVVMLHPTANKITYTFLYPTRTKNLKLLCKWTG